MMQDQVLDTLLRLLPVGVVIADASGRIVSINRQATEIWGREIAAPDVAGYRVYKGFHADGRPYEPEEWPLARSALKGEAVADEEIRIERAGGEQAIIQVNSAPLRDEAGRIVGAAAAFYDITRRKRAEEQFQDLNERLEERVSEQTDESRQLAERLRALAFEVTQTEQRERRHLANLLHDQIQQVLAAALIRLQVARRVSASGATNEMLTEADRYVHEALVASRSLAVELSPPVLRDTGLAAGLYWLARRMHEQSHFVVQVSAELNAEPESADMRFFLFESVRELLFNAQRHSGVSSARVRMEREGDRWTKLVVEDPGHGFDPAAIKPSPQRDTHFGLFNLQQRLTYLGGRVSIESSSRGTHITLWAPLRETPAPVVAAPVPPPPVEACPIEQRASGIRVLLVDDHRLLREGVSRMLRLEKDIRIVGEAGDGEQAVAETERLQPNVVLMDISMPGMNGIEATRIVHQRWPQVKVIVLSMHEDPDVMEAMQEAGATAYLTKGAPIVEIVAAIRATRPSEAAVGAKG